MDTIVLLADFNDPLYSDQCGESRTYQQNTEEAVHPGRATTVHNGHIHSKLGEIYLSQCTYQHVLHFTVIDGGRKQENQGETSGHENMHKDSKQ